MASKNGCPNHPSIPNKPTTLLFSHIPGFSPSERPLPEALKPERGIGKGNTWSQKTKRPRLNLGYGEEKRTNGSPVPSDSIVISTPPNRFPQFSPLVRSIEPGTVGHMTSERGQSNPSKTDSTSLQKKRPPETVAEELVSAQERLARLQQEKEELERQLVTIEELRRRQIEWETGRQEVLEKLTRGLALLEEAEAKARRQAGRLNRLVEGFREALAQVKAIDESSWTEEDYPEQLSKALTVLDNARMEWNAAVLEWPELAKDSEELEPETVPNPGSASSIDWIALLRRLRFWEWVRIGLALFFPVWVVGLLLAMALLVIALR